MASGAMVSASVQACAPLSASRTCQRSPVRISCEPLAEAAVGGRDQSGSRPRARNGLEQRHRNGHWHEVSP
jgi:hypothetical protein